MTSTLPSSLGERVLARLPLVVGLIVLAAAVAFIYSVIQMVSLSAVIQSFWAVPSYKLLSALVLTAASYVALCTYDIMSFRLLGRVISSRKVAVIAAVSYAVSQAVGFGTLTGGAIRYRLYSALGVSSIEIVQVTALSALTFLLGVSAVGGLALLTEAAGLPQILSVSPIVEGAGSAIILCMAVYLAWRAAGPGGVAAFGFNLQLPGVRVTLLQIVLGAADVGVSAAALWVLLPDNAALSLPAFTGIFAALIATGIVLHIPGSIGVLVCVR